MQAQRDESSKSEPFSEGQSSRLQSLKRFFCPCMLPALNKPKIRDTDSSVQSKIDKQSIQNSTKVQINAALISTKKKSRRLSEQIRQNQNIQHRSSHKDDAYQPPSRYIRESMHIELTYNNRIRSMQELQLSVCNLTQNYLLSMGQHCEHILIKVAPVTIQINPDIFKRQITQQSARSRPEKTPKYKNYEFNKFWDERYQFFQKFDEGIKMKQQSWTTTPNQSMAQYIASKCQGAKIILDAFAGVGSISIKLASLNSVAKVISNEKDKEKLSFLLNNANIYEINNFLELSNQDFQKVERKGIQIVFLHPPKVDFENQKRQLSTLIGRAMKLAPNLVMLLPPETSIDMLCTLIYNWAQQYGWMKDFCSVKVQKIYCKLQVKYLLLCAGKLVQPEIKLNDELDYIYGRLRKYGDKTYRHKKIVKKIRQQNGMLELLHLIKLAEKMKKEAFLGNPVNQQLEVIDFFYQLIVTKNLISIQRLNKIKHDQEESYSKSGSIFHSGTVAEQIFQRSSPFQTVMQEQKIQQSPRRQPQITNSQYSYQSYFESLEKRQLSSLQPNSQNKSFESGSGVIIKRTFNSSSPRGQSMIEEQVKAEDQPTENQIQTNTKRNSQSAEGSKGSNEYRKKSTLLKN